MPWGKHRKVHKFCHYKLQILIKMVMKLLSLYLTKEISLVVQDLWQAYD